jgi:hypothetical protein
MLLCLRRVFQSESIIWLHGRLPFRNICIRIFASCRSLAWMLFHSRFIVKICANAATTSSGAGLTIQVRNVTRFWQLRRARCKVECSVRKQADIADICAPRIRWTIKACTPKAQAMARRCHCKSRRSHSMIAWLAGACAQIRRLHACVSVVACCLRT